MSAGACWECGQRTPHIHHHHVVPRSRGGTRTVPLCQECHAKAHHRGKRMTISEMTREALARKRANGERLGGELPIGKALAADGVTLKDNPQEAAAVASILELRADGLSIRKIAAELNRRGVPARGKRWHPTTVARLLRRVR